MGGAGVTQVLVAAVVAGVLALLVRSLMVERRQDRFRALLRAALVVAGPVLPLAAVVLVVPGPGDDMRSLMLTALLGAAGWTITYLQGLSQAEEDQLDLLEALRAEMQIVLEQSLAMPPEDFAARLDALIDEAVTKGQKYVPFFPAPSRPVVFEAVAARIDQLPTEVVESVVKFYSATADLRAFCDDLRSETFADLPLDRRRSAYARYFAMTRTQGDLARTAINGINARFGLLPLPVEKPRDAGAPAAVSKTDRGPSGPESAPEVSA